MLLHSFSGRIQTTPFPSRQRGLFFISAQIIPLSPSYRTEQYWSVPLTVPLIFSEKRTHNEIGCGRLFGNY
jgi:hypothetical protein